MVSNKVVLVMIIIAVLILGASLVISNFFSSEDIKLNNVLEGNQQGSLNLVVNPPSQAPTTG